MHMLASETCSIKKMLPFLVFCLVSVTQLLADSVSLLTALQQAHPCYDVDASPEDCLLLTEQKRAEDRVEAALETVMPCSCETLPRLLDLGREYFPRYLPSVECGAGACWRGPYRCKQRVYEVKVLKRRDQADEVSRRHDLTLPESLRASWKFVLVKVIVACECSL